MIYENNRQTSDLQNNRIIGNIENLDPKTDIRFSGKGNILFLEDHANLKNCKLNFKGDNAVIYISANKNFDTYLMVDAWSGTSVFIGSDNYFNGSLNCIAAERKNLIIGKKGTFSYGIWIRTSDIHLLYDIETGNRINLSKSVMVGDHVWLGQAAMILKGTRIGSGSVIAAGTVLANKSVGSNSVYGGNPARRIRRNVFYNSASTNNYSPKDTEDSMTNNRRDYVYDQPGTIDFDSIDDRLSRAETADMKLTILKGLAENTDHNRFSIVKMKKKLFGIF